MALSTWISDVTNSTLNITLSTFSFQDALDPSGNAFGYPPFLFHSGCLQSDGTQNCTASCQDPNAIFGSLDTLHNCMVYPTVADLYARNNLSNASLPIYFDIQKSEIGSELYHNITTTIRTCLVDYCTVTLDGSGCKDGLDAYDNTSSPLNLTSSFYIYKKPYEGDNTFDFCQYVPQSINQDIGGIGVYVSYWIQTGLTLLTFFLVVWWNWGIYYICLGALLLPRGYSKAQKNAQRIRNTSRNKHLPSLTGALVDFQKAQCFFMLAINIAALINRKKGGFQPNSLQQLYNTYILIKSISISGYLPVTFTLFTLHLVDMVSWYLMVLSIVTVLVSIATLFIIGNFNPSQDDLNYLSQQALSGGPDTCGTKNLGVYCYAAVGGTDDSDATNPASGAYSMLAFCLVVLILLVAHQYHAFKDPSTGKPRPWLYSLSLRKIQRGLALISIALRKIQGGLALISIALNGYAINASLTSANYYTYNGSLFDILGAPEFVMFASCWTLVFVIYLSLTSSTAYTRNDRPIGRFFNRKIVFAVDFLSAIFWFAGFIALALNYRSGPCGYDEAGVCDTNITSILVGVCLWITFFATSALAVRHMLRTRDERSEKHTYGKKYWILQRFNNHHLKRQLSEKVRLSWKRLTRMTPSPPSWKHLIRMVPSWKETSRKLPSWTKHPLIIDTYARLRQNTFPTMKVYTRRACRDLKTHASELDWPSMIAPAALFSMYIIFSGLFLNWFAIFIQDLAWFAYNGVDIHTWSFGQIVAITVWAEPLCEYFHLELRGMKRGFEHRLWGYKVVKIKQPDAERGILTNPPSSIHSISPPSASPDDKDTDENGDLTTADFSVNGSPAQDDEHTDEGEGNNSGDAEPLISPVPALSREGSEDAGERDGAGDWQIPETVFLTSESISSF